MKGVNIFGILYIKTYFKYFTYFAYCRYLEQCQVDINGNGNPIMATGKKHSMIHTIGDVARYGDAIYVFTPPRRPTSAGPKNKVSGTVCTSQGPQ